MTSPTGVKRTPAPYLLPKVVAHPSTLTVPRLPAPLPPPKSRTQGSKSLLLCRAHLRPSTPSAASLLWPWVPGSRAPLSPRRAVLFHVGLRQKPTAPVLVPDGAISHQTLEPATNTCV